ncbi:DUF1120 domain-containing protein [Pseudomonas fluorescens]|nr:DUF1120 domain-containing protein [Pseudomonas fluorescens]
MHPSRVMIAGAFLLAGVSAVSTVMAASNVDLSVVGKIIPSACTPTLSNGGIVDHGKIALQDFPAYGYKALPQATVQLEVTCNAPMLMAVKAIDNRVGTAIPAYPTDPSSSLSRFGLGLTSGDKMIGWYELKLVNATADGAPGALIEAVNVTGPWFDANANTIWQPGWMRTVRDSSSAEMTPLPVMAFTADVVVLTTLTERRNLPVTEETPMDGSATVEVNYL